MRPTVEQQILAVKLRLNLNNIKCLSYCYLSSWSPLDGLDSILDYDRELMCSVDKFIDHMMKNQRYILSIGFSDIAPNVISLEFDAIGNYKLKSDIIHIYPVDQSHIDALIRDFRKGVRYLEEIK